jgi:hypothetical protein
MCFAAMQETYHLSLMRGIRAGVAIPTMVFCLGLIIAACGGSKNTRTTSTAVPPGAEEAERSPRRGIVACRLHSCSPPYFCNEETGLCEMRACQSKTDCPYDYDCDFSRNVCR